MSDFFWIGNHPGLDLVNTEAVDDHGDRVDLLRHPGDLLDWIDAAGLAPGARVDEARAWTTGPDGDRLLAWTRRLRAAARRLLDPTVATTDRATHELDALVGDVPVRLGHPRVATDAPLTATGDLGDELRLPLALAVLDALRLDRRQLRRCEGERCILLFHDTSRNRSRRWCDMAVCGNRAKAAAHYRRQKASAATPGVR